jgi:hypothetical protein
MSLPLKRLIKGGGGKQRGGSERHYIFKEQQNTFPILKVRRQCPHILLLQESLEEDKPLGNGRVKG